MARCRPWLGTFVTIDAATDSAIEAGFAAIERVHRLMSAHEPESELSRLNRGQRVALSGDTRTVLDRALFWHRHSNGLFDPAAAGAAALARGALPRHPGQPIPGAGMEVLRFEGDHACLTAPACLDLGGIAKGHAVDAALAAIREAGAAWGLVNAGGDLAAFGHPLELAIPDPLTQEPRVMVTLEDHALATSAGLPEGAGLDFAHLPTRDPALVSATVIAPRAIDADALTKLVLARAPGLAALLGLADARALAFTAGGEVIEP